MAEMPGAQERLKRHTLPGRVDCQKTRHQAFLAQFMVAIERLNSKPRSAAWTAQYDVRDGEAWQPSLEADRRIRSTNSSIAQTMRVCDEKNSAKLNLAQDGTSISTGF
jgi:hypothetical protein